MTTSVSLIDPLVNSVAAPNQVRDPTAVANGALGTLKLRRRFTNNTGLPIVALRYRVITIPNQVGGIAAAGDYRLLNSPAQTITLTDTTTVSSQVLTVQTPAAQAAGGGLNTSVAEGVITTTAPLANGASTVVAFNLGMQVDGSARFHVVPVALTVPPQ